MTCSFTVDNYADSATYNGNPLTIITDATYVENLGYTNLAIEKLVNFKSVHWVYGKNVKMCCTVIL